MTLTEAVKIFETFNNWCIGVLDPHNPYSQFSEYPADQVLEAQGIILTAAKEQQQIIERTKKLHEEISETSQVKPNLS